MIVKLEDVCTKASSNVMQKNISNCIGEYKIFGASGYLGNVDFYHQEKPYVAVVKDGAGIGRTFLLPEKSSVIGTMQYLLPKDNVIAEYLYYVVRFMHLEKYFSGATIPHIYYKDYKNETFNLVPINQQKNIVFILNKLDSVILKRKQQLEQLDLLVKSRFVEMFGDPIKNQFGWEQTNIKNIGIGKLTYGSGASAIDYDGNCRYIRITDIANNGLLNNEKKSPSIFDEKYLLHSGDILFARSGATVGKTFLYDEKKHGKSVYAGYLIKLTPDLTKVNSQYVFWFTNTYYYKSFVQSVQKAVAQPNINAQEYGNLTICLPPLELQNKFAQFVEQVEKSKTQVQKSLDEAQLLFNSLMQEYFG